MSTVETPLIERFDEVKINVGGTWYDAVIDGPKCRKCGYNRYPTNCDHCGSTGLDNSKVEQDQTYKLAGDSIASIFAKANIDFDMFRQMHQMIEIVKKKEELLATYIALERKVFNVLEPPRKNIIKTARITYDRNKGMQRRLRKLICEDKNLRAKFTRAARQINPFIDLAVLPETDGFRQSHLLDQLDEAGNFITEPEDMFWKHDTEEQGTYHSYFKTKVQNDKEFNFEHSHSGGGIFHRDNQVWKYGGGVVMLVGFSNGYEGANTVAWEDRRAFFRQDYKEFKDSDDQVMGAKRRCQITRGDILRFSHETYHGVEDLLAGERKLLNIEVFPDYRFRKPILNYWGVDGVEEYNFFGAEWVDAQFDVLHGIPYEMLGEIINQIRERFHKRAEELKTPKPTKAASPAAAAAAKGDLCSSQLLS